ncbi:MAG TPA: S1 RNA-binding domain-containing protein [Anaerolineales bacterium]|jgi:ribosomal protein S1
MQTQDTAPVSALEPKAKVSGKIIKTTLAGALVDIGQPLPGVIHISQLSKDPINKVEDVVQEGKTIEAWVRRVHKDRVELTMIEPVGMEWREIKPDMIVKGKVVRLEAYGAFVDFGAERPGLVHVSELTRGYVKTPNEIVKEGDEVEAKVLEVDRRKRQIRLSMKALLPEIVEEQKPEREERKPRGARKPRQEEVETESAPQEPSEPDLTGMQIAWMQAQERANEETKHQKSRRTKREISQENEEIFNRTLEKRLPTGG